MRTERGIKIGEDMMTAEEFVQEISVGLSAVYNWINKGQLEIDDLEKARSGRVLINRSECEIFKI